MFKTIKLVFFKSRAAQRFFFFEMQLWDALGNTNLGNPDAEKRTYSKTLHRKTSDAQKNLHRKTSNVTENLTSSANPTPKKLRFSKKLTFSHVGFLD